MNDLVSHHDQINELLEQIRAGVASIGDESKIASLIATLRAEELRGPISNPDVKWLDDKKSGPARLARAQAHLFLDYVSREKPSFDNLISKPDDTPAVAFFQAFKLFLDEPRIHAMDQPVPTKTSITARRASHSFARDVISSDRYEVVAEAAGLPPAALEENDVWQKSRRKSDREHAFDLSMAIEVHRLRERGMAYGNISVELDIDPVLPSIYDRYLRPAAKIIDTSAPSSVVQSPGPVRQLANGHWQIDIGDRKPVELHEKQLVAIIRDHQARTVLRDLGFTE